jgi:hypothetical protein
LRRARSARLRVQAGGETGDETTAEILHETRARELRKRPLKAVLDGTKRMYRSIRRAREPDPID